MEAIARQVVASARAMVPGRFHARAASPATHPHVDWRAYEDARRRLQALGFRHLGDVHPVSLEGDPRMSRPNVMRIFASEDGTVTAGFYRMALRWTPLGIMARMLGGAGGMTDLITLYPDGTIIETSNAAPARVWQDPPFLLREYLPRRTPVEQLVARHQERLRERADAVPRVAPVAVHSLLEVIAASDMTEGAKRAYRQRIGWITREELARLSRLSGERLDQLEAAVRRVVAEEPPPPLPAASARLDPEAGLRRR
ncbi:MAG TPA: hypothetical protein VHG08_24720 [Longimicrobium sp.]|nr:hypothetical protein [Longimicrobium sp.]